MSAKPVSKIEVAPVSNDDSFKLILVAGQFLNSGNNGVSKPLLVCLYVVNARDWQLPLTRDQGNCIEKKSDADLFHTARVILAPGKTQEVILPMKSGSQNWLIVNPDYSQNLIDHTPQKSLMTSNVSRVIMLGEHTKQANVPIKRGTQNSSDPYFRSNKKLEKLEKLENLVKNGSVDSKLKKKHESITRLKNMTSSGLLLVNN